MQPVSTEFNQAARETVRRVDVLLEIIWASPQIDANVTTVVNDNNRISYPAQVHDGVRNTTQKWAHLDGTIIADGSFKVMPGTPDNSTFRQVGWYGGIECNGSGEWVTDPQIELTFDARPIDNLLVIGDEVYIEYPVDFTIDIYEGATLEYTENVIGNTLVEWTSDISAENITAATRMLLTVHKWSTPNRVVKITEFYTTFSVTYTGDVVDSLNLLEERILEDGTLPVGNISANELDLALNNVKITVDGQEVIDPFFPDNPNSPYKEVLTKNRRVKPSLGFQLENGSFEYVKLGTFWTGDWQVNEQSPVVNVACRDRMELLRKAEYKGSALYTNTNLFELAEVVLESARDDIPISDLLWDIDPTLTNFTLPYGWFGKTTYFEAIRQIAEACLGQAYMSRDDILIIEGPEKTYQP